MEFTNLRYEALRDLFKDHRLPLAFVDLDSFDNNVDYAASGAIEKSRLPLPVMPVGIKYVGLEGAGEVQTPLVPPPNCPNLALGDPVFFQHAKAGELCERFNELILMKGGKIIDRVKTYRGEGFAFV
jgi:D-serine deaminase-like pyridoxal phosphate-dependent protein